MIIYQIMKNKKVTKSGLVPTWDTATRICLDEIPKNHISKEIFDGLYENGYASWNNLEFIISKGEICGEQINQKIAS